ncbi:hypothetical protein PAMC26510_07525 [Caballeronia sordidicola]|uniref:Uncharacterized protein n=1 Tax=Caballeronia sordidicola TaxID=196367 RepID=A0A242N4X8_CABSO|nr:hypothetical protein PAMC26510_07525 [Caballeronia sordidicola]OTP78216.1 hypothetical protein PAMC26577_06155 [Caballeronia sordidicola]
MQRYDGLAARGTIERDSAQARIVAALDALAGQLGGHQMKHSRFGRFRAVTV